MKVLIACEESQEVCKAFRELGHEAFSCDILPCSGGHPEWHIQDDVLKHLNDGWDLMIAHPPCTDIAVSGARHFKEKIADGRQQRALDFVTALLNAPIEKIALENPVSIISSKIRKPNQIIQPWMFGHEAQKTTCLWLKNLQKLIPTKIVGKGEFITFSSGKKLPAWYSKLSGKGKERSKTFSGIAKAMAEQWGIESKPQPQIKGCSEKEYISCPTCNGVGCLVCAYEGNDLPLRESKPQPKECSESEKNILERGDISLCSNCNSMTYNIEGICGKMLNDFQKCGDDIGTKYQRKKGIKNIILCNKCKLNKCKECEEAGVPKEEICPTCNLSKPQSLKNSKAFNDNLTIPQPTGCGKIFVDRGQTCKCDRFYTLCPSCRGEK